MTLVTSDQSGCARVVSIRFDVIVKFGRRHPSASEVMALRRAYAPFRDVPIGELRQQLDRQAKDTWTCRLEFFTKPEAEAVVEGLSAAGVDAYIVPG